MANWTQLIGSITDNIKENGNQEITGTILQGVLKQMVEALGATSGFKGIAVPATSPLPIDGTAFYIATEAGTYANLGGTTIASEGIYIFEYKDGAWTSYPILVDNKTEYYNVTTRVPPSEGTFYSLSTAIAAIESQYKKIGFKATFEVSANIWQSYQFIGSSISTWATTSNWKLVSVSGLYGNISISTDLNTISQTGDYTCYGTASNVPSASYSWFIEHRNSGVGIVYAYQRAIAYSTEIIIYERTKISSTWGTWKRQSGGVLATTGSSETSPMSQKSVTDELTELELKVGDLERWKSPRNIMVSTYQPVTWDGSKIFTWSYKIQIWFNNSIYYDIAAGSIECLQGRYVIASLSASEFIPLNETVTGTAHLISVTNNFDRYQKGCVVIGKNHSTKWDSPYIQMIPKYWETKYTNAEALDAVTPTITAVSSTIVENQTKEKGLISVNGILHPNLPQFWVSSINTVPSLMPTIPEFLNKLGLQYAIKWTPVQGAANPEFYTKTSTSSGFIPPKANQYYRWSYYIYSPELSIDCLSGRLRPLWTGGTQFTGITGVIEKIDDYVYLVTGNGKFTGDVTNKTGLTLETVLKKTDGSTFNSTDYLYVTGISLAYSYNKYFSVRDNFLYDKMAIANIQLNQEVEQSIIIGGDFTNTTGKNFGVYDSSYVSVIDDFLNKEKGLANIKSVAATSGHDLEIYLYINSLNPNLLNTIQSSNGKYCKIKWYLYTKNGDIPNSLTANSVGIVASTSSGYKSWMGSNTDYHTSLLKITDNVYEITGVFKIDFTEGDTLTYVNISTVLRSNANTGNLLGEFGITGLSMYISDSYSDMELITVKEDWILPCTEQIIETIVTDQIALIPQRYTYNNITHNLSQLSEFLRKYEMKEVDEYNQLSITMAGDSIFGRQGAAVADIDLVNPEMLLTLDSNNPPSISWVAVKNGGITTATATISSPAIGACYKATAAGTYTNFESLVLADGDYVGWNGSSWQIVTEFGYQSGHFPPNMWVQNVSFKLLNLLQFPHADVKYYNHVASEVTKNGTWSSQYPVGADCIRLSRTYETNASIQLSFSDASFAKFIYSTYAGNGKTRLLKITISDDEGSTWENIEDAGFTSSLPLDVDSQLYLPDVDYKWGNIIISGLDKTKSYILKVQKVDSTGTLDVWGFETWSMPRINMVVTAEGGNIANDQLIKWQRFYSKMYNPSLIIYELPYINDLGTGRISHYKGVATTSTIPSGSPLVKDFWYASETGIYTNFNAQVLIAGDYVEWNGSNWISGSVELEDELVSYSTNNENVLKRLSSLGCSVLTLIPHESTSFVSRYFCFQNGLTILRNLVSKYGFASIDINYYQRINDLLSTIQADGTHLNDLGVTTYITLLSELFQITYTSRYVNVSSPLLFTKLTGEGDGTSTISFGYEFSSIPIVRVYNNSSIIITSKTQSDFSVTGMGIFDWEAYV